MLGVEIVLNLISQITALVSLVVLYLASFGVPWKKQSFSGETPKELRHKRRQRILGWWIGLPCGVTAVLCQFVITIVGHFRI